MREGGRRSKLSPSHVWWWWMRRWQSSIPTNRPMPQRNRTRGRRKKMVKKKLECLTKKRLRYDQSGSPIAPLKPWNQLILYQRDKCASWFLVQGGTCRNTRISYRLLPPHSMLIKPATPQAGIQTIHFFKFHIISWGATTWGTWLRTLFAKMTVGWIRK